MAGIAEQIRAIEDPEKRRRDAEKWLTTLYHFRDPMIPAGYLQTSEFTTGDLDKIAEEGRRCFRETKEALGGTPPEILLTLEARFERNYQQMQRLAAMTPQGRRNLPPHEIFPFYDNFGRAIRADRLWADVNIDYDKMHPEFLKQGGTATIYKVTAQDGRPLALKLFKPIEQMTQLQMEVANPTRNYILENIVKNHKLFSERPFIPPRAATDPWHFHA
ncbi:hypothetical protein HZB90_02620 [archaeon]|nr:hypothetical protein [archaeon]